LISTTPGRSPIAELLVAAPQMRSQPDLGVATAPENVAQAIMGAMASFRP
jgi:hypothetical protein